MNISVKDDFISLQRQTHIKNIVEDRQNFLWECGDTTTWPNIPPKKQMIHSLVYAGQATSNYTDHIIGCFQELPEWNTHDLFRAKINLNFPHKTRNFIAPHTDFSHPEAVTYLYYIGDSDGLTVIYDDIVKDTPTPSFWWKKTRIKPKQGRAVRFPSNILHSGNVPYKYPERIVLNLIFTPKR